MDNNISLDELTEYAGLNARTVNAWVREQEHLPEPIGGWSQLPHRWNRREVLEWVTARTRQLGHKARWAIRTARLTAVDAWGKTHAATIEWLPEDITWTDPACENAGWTVLAHGDPNDPPARLGRGSFGHVGCIEATRRSVQGGFWHVVEFSEVENSDDLAPGTFRVLPGRCPVRGCGGH